jgi:uncharacterized membrane protein
VFKTLFLTAKDQFIQNWQITAPTFVFAVLFLLLLLCPSLYAEKEYDNISKVPAIIQSVDNQGVKQIGATTVGEQICQVVPTKGPLKGKILEGTNLLMGKMESDKLFVSGDKALAAINFDGDQVLFVNLIDHYRIDKIIWLVALFVLFLIAFAGWTGVRSFLSFGITVLSIWKWLIPAFLNGYNPIFLTVSLVSLLTIIIIVFVYGLDRRSVAAILGTLAGLIATVLLAYGGLHLFKIHGAVMAYSETLIYSGYAHLDLSALFIASIFLAACGAMMDVAVDITSAVHEVAISAPHYTKKELIQSGMNVGRSVMGTMTTTLLFAYSGSALGLFMVFMAQGTPMVNILNLNYVSAEILHTLAGSIGLVTVAPFTAFFSGVLLGEKQSTEVKKVYLHL